LNAFTGKDLIKEYNGKVYTKNENNYTGWGFPEMAKCEVNTEDYLFMNELYGKFYQY
jgi:hypothetical protein